MFGRRRKAAAAAGVVGAAVMVLVGCSSAPSTPVLSTASSKPTTITVWTFNKLPKEVTAMQNAIDRLQKANPWLTVNLVLNKRGDDFTKAVTAGDAPDVFISASADDTAKFCDNGTVVDMKPLAEQADLDIAKTFPKAVLGYTQYQGKQCALPLLVDGYALYYNKDLLQAAGVTEPPKTLSELTEVAKKLTVKNPDGSIKTFGLLPPTVAYAQNGNYFIGGQTGTPFYDKSGKATFGTAPAWEEELNWQKDILDFYGKQNVTNFVAKYNSHEDDASNPFVTGAVAMEMAGEWHIGEIAANAPSLNYATAPLPVPDSASSAYGAGTVNGTSVYISATSEKQAAAFLAVKQLTTDSQFLTTFASQISNIPTTFDSLSKWKEADDPNWKTFTAMTADPKSFYKTLTPAGSEDRDNWVRFIADWEAGKVGDLKSGLKQIGQQINDLNG